MEEDNYFQVNETELIINDVKGEDQEFPLIRGDSIEQEIERNLNNVEIGVESKKANKEKYDSLVNDFIISEPYRVKSEAIPFMMYDGDLPDNLLSFHTFEKNDSSDGEFDLSKIKNKVLENDFNSEFQPEPLSQMDDKNGTIFPDENACKFFNDFDDQLLYQVEVLTDKNHEEQCDTKEINLPHVQRSQSKSSTYFLTDDNNKDEPITNELKRNVSLVLSDHNYITQSPSNVRNDETLKNAENISELHTCLDVIINKINDFRDEKEANNNDVTDFLTEMTTTIQNFCKKIPKNSIENTVEHNKNVETDKECEIIDIEPNLFKKANTITFSVDYSVENPNTELLENCSEPLEFQSNKSFDGSTIDDKGNFVNGNEDEDNFDSQEEQESLNLLLNDNDIIESEKISKISAIIKFGKLLLLSCDQYQKDKTSNLDDFVQKICTDFRAITSLSNPSAYQEFSKSKPIRNNLVDASCQTIYTGRIISKDKQRRINEKEKKRLLASSESSESSDSSSDYDEFERIESGNERLSSTSIDRDSANDDDDLSAVSNVYDHSDGMDLSKYVTKEEISDEDCRNDKVATPAKFEDEENDKLCTGKKEVSQTDDQNIGPAQLHASNEDSNSGKSKNEQKSTIDDEKLYSEPIVVLDKLSEQNLQDAQNNLSDKEIDKLLDIESLLRKKQPQSNSYIYLDRDKKTHSKKEKNLIEILKETDKNVFSDDSSVEDADEFLTEQQYLEQCNNGIKEKLLNSSSSDSDEVSQFSDEELLETNNNKYLNSDDSNSSQMLDRFLQEYVPKENEEKSDTEHIDENSLNKNFTDVTSCKEQSNQESPMKEVSDEEQDKISADNINRPKNSDNEARNISAADDTGNDKKNLTSNFDKRPMILPKNLIISKNLLEEDFDIKQISLPNESPVIAKNREGDSENSDCEILNISKQIRKRNNVKSLEEMMEKKNKSKNVKHDDFISLSSDDESDLEEIENEEITNNRTIKPMLRQDQLAGETRIAQKQEAERIRRLDKKNQLLAKVQKELALSGSGSSNDKSDLVLDYNSETKTFIKVHSDLVKHLKPHQIDGVKFMYDSCYGSVDNLKKHPGSGCILAHCMGLGKTLQLIALLHTVISYKELQTSKILVLCPKSTVMNWADEMVRWLGPLHTKHLKVFQFLDTSDIKEKLKVLQEWSKSGTPGFRQAGCLLIGYEAFRTLIYYHVYKKKRATYGATQIEAIRQKIRETLIEPADLVICDEGHIIKNRKSAISSAVAELTTSRRIILTGTPIQNNLKEYYSMVNFIKPSFLGTEREFGNLYANPIKNGQHKDSSKHDIKIMKQRSFVLHKKLSKFVQRREAALLKTFLPEKFEYVIFIPLTDVQVKLYKFFLQTIGQRDACKFKSLITDYTCLRKIWTHPKVLEDAWQNANLKPKKDMKRQVSTPNINSDDEVPDDVYDSQTGVLSVTRDWWRPMVTEKDLESLFPSNKMITMFEILRMCEENNEKCLIFSAFVAVLNVVEYFMAQINNQSSKRFELGIDHFKGPWVTGKDYYRLDGKTSKTVRHEMVKNFNNPSNRRARCFLISARAGGQGINLIGANRVIILDTSWNPSNDQQNIFRIFRLGQKKKCFVYRLLAMGTMEEKVYSRSVTKQAMSFRVVDEQQIDRHYNMAELSELYCLHEPNYSERPVPVLPQDSILASLLRNYPSMVFKYHEHDSLLENKLDQELSEQEKADAWSAYERDLQYNSSQTTTNNLGMFPQLNSAGVFPPMDFTGRPYPIGFGLDALSMMANGLNSSMMSNYGSNIFDMYMYQSLASKGIPPAMMPNINQQSLLNFHQQYSPDLRPSTSNSLMNSLPGFDTLSNLSPNLSKSNYPSSAYPPVCSASYFNSTLGTTSDSRLMLDNHNHGQQNKSYPSTVHSPNVQNFGPIASTNYQNSSSILTSSANSTRPSPSPSQVATHLYSNTLIEKSLSPQQVPSIPTSVIMKSPELGNSTITKSVVSAKDRDSPTPHVILKNHVHNKTAQNLIIPDRMLPKGTVAEPVNIKQLAALPVNQTGAIEVSQSRTRSTNMGIFYPNTNSAPSTSATSAVTISKPVSSTTSSNLQDESLSTLSHFPNISVRSVSSLNNSAASTDNLNSANTQNTFTKSLKKPITMTNFSKKPSVNEQQHSVNIQKSNKPMNSIVSQNFLKPAGKVGQISKPNNMISTATRSLESPTSKNFTSTLPALNKKNSGSNVNAIALSTAMKKGAIEKNVMPVIPGITYSKGTTNNKVQNVNITNSIMPKNASSKPNAGEKIPVINTASVAPSLSMSTNKKIISKSPLQIKSISSGVGGGYGSKSIPTSTISSNKYPNMPSGILHIGTSNSPSITSNSPTSMKTLNSISSIKKTTANSQLNLNNVANPRRATTKTVPTKVSTNIMVSKPNSHTGGGENLINQSIRTLENMNKSAANAGITISPNVNRKSQLTSPSSLQQVLMTKSSIPNSDILAIKRSAPATEKQRQIKKIKLDSHVDKNVVESLRRIQTSQGLTVVSKNLSNAIVGQQRSNKSGKPTEIVEID